jgi:cellulose synthase/poly-beta-1,6-N-acetylglucosamine synthase-like glycosyltransferase
LEKIDLNPPGLVIEDFNMTFELHHKKLGRIVHHPSISGYTQDPDNLGDYFQQIRRWNLGLWQTMRHHGFWPSRFWFALLLLLGEVVLSGLVVIVLPCILIILALCGFFPEYAPIVQSVLPWFLKLFIFGIWLPDIILSLIVGCVQKRPQYFYFAPLFIFMKFVDAVAFLYTIPKAFLAKSSGKWVSPTRRAN